MDEIRLIGGNVSTVVRVGRTVRRTVGPWTPAVHTLLRTLRAAGITEVPEPRGTDEDGREILTFLDGEVPHHPVPAWLWEPDLLDQAGALLRRVHDASVPLVGQPLTWGGVPHEPAEVICHNDVAPYNTAFVDGTLRGLFDFDTAAPGPRLWDLAHLAYRMVPFSSDTDEAAPSPDERTARVDRLVGAYGLPVRRADLLATVAGRLDELARWTDARAAETGREDLRAHARLYRRDRDSIAAHAS